MKKYSFNNRSFKGRKKAIIILSAVILLLASCKTLDKTSSHGFNSGYYSFEDNLGNTQNVYLDVTDEKVDVYHQEEKIPDKIPFFNVSLKPEDSLAFSPTVFNKASIDLDITSILFKYRPSVYGLQGQLTTDFNIALYTGWRHDTYSIISKKDPLGRKYNKITSFGYDIGIFAGSGVTLISPFTTNNERSDEYSGMIFQTGIAGFIESNFASFGIGIGLDFLLNSDREVWIYRNKPWVGFMVGVAIN